MPIKLRDEFLDEHRLGNAVKKPDQPKDPVHVASEQTIETTLAERGSRYGTFPGHASITQAIKSVMRGTNNWHKLAPDQQEALEMIAHKIGRILNGDPNYHDSWHDIVGYTKLVADRLVGKVQ